MNREEENKENVLKYFDGDDLASSTFFNKYSKGDLDNPDELHERMAEAFYNVEKRYPRKKESKNLSSYGVIRNDLNKETIKKLFKDFKYVIPAGSVMAGIGSDRPVSLSNCFVIDSPKDSYTELMKTRTEQVCLMKRRGGCVEENTKVIEKNKGIIPIKEVKKGDEVLSFNIETRKDEFQKVIDWYYTDVKLDEQIEVKYKNGVSLLTSSRHPILSLKEDGYSYESYEKKGLKNNVNKTVNFNNIKFQQNNVCEEFYKLTDEELLKIENYNILSQPKSIGITSLKYFYKLGIFSKEEFNEISSRVSLKEVVKDDEKKKNYIDIMVAGNNNYYAGNFGFVNIHNCGYDLSNLRPRECKVNNAAKTSTGAASFMEVCSAITNETAQNGRRKSVLNY